MYISVYIYIYVYTYRWTRSWPRFSPRHTRYLSIYIYIIIYIYYYMSICLPIYASYTYIHLPGIMYQVCVYIYLPIYLSMCQSYLSDSSIRHLSVAGEPALRGFRRARLRSFRYHRRASAPVNSAAARLVHRCFRRSMAQRYVAHVIRDWFHPATNRRYPSVADEKNVRKGATKKGFVSGSIGRCCLMQIN